MAETLFEEMKRYVRFDVEDRAALQAFGPIAAPHFREIAEQFYDRIREHEQARRVFLGPAQVERLKVTLCAWMDLLFKGPWDEGYYRIRARIGRVHVQIGLEQRYMFTAMNLIRLALQRLVLAELPDGPQRTRTIVAVGKIIDLELAIMLETYREAFVGQVQEIERQEKDRLEHRLAISEARYEQIIEQGGSMVTTFDERRVILLFNRQCEELTGLQREEALGRDWLDVFVAPEERREVEERFAVVWAGGRVAPWDGKVPGSLDRRVRWNLTTLPSGAGTLLCAIGIDITEERELAVRTRRAERLAALGTMAAGLAHEIRNPLNAASLQLTVVKRRLLRSDGADVEGARAAAELVSSEMSRLAQLVDEFLQFARPQPLRLRPTDLRGVARGVLELVGPDAETAGGRVTLAPGPSVFVQLDEERMKQVLHNLLRNALEAVGHTGRVEMRVVSDVDGARVEVEDDGPGLPSPDAPIFEPFFTTKASGTGLGLAIVHRIVSDHGGRITVETRPGRTVFSVWLPTSA